MKQFLTLVLMGISIVACQKDNTLPENAYRINGTAEGVYDGIRVHLKSLGERGAETIHDSAIVMNGSFKFEGEIQDPQMWLLSVNSVEGFLPLVIENKTLDVVVTKDDLSQSTVKGSKSNDGLQIFTKSLNEMNEKRMKLISLNRQPMQQNNPAAVKTDANSELQLLNKEIGNFPLEFLDNNKDNYFSLFLIENLLQGSTDVDAIDKRFENLDNDLKSTSLGRILKGMINQKKAEAKAVANLNIGHVAPEFSAPNPDGKTVSLSEIKGKVTLIDFWAAWCGPCRRENPNVVKIYDKYHSKGLEIIGVSLDKPNDKARWVKAIADDKLAWHQVSHLNYFNDPIARMYNIQSIPSTFLLDAEGRIIAKNLRGQALEDKIAEYLD